MENAIHSVFERHLAWSQVKSVIEVFNRNGFKAFLAGGAVRDALLGRPIHDFDLATSARPEEVEQLFSKTLMIGRSFGVSMIVLEGFTIEVTTFRSDDAYVDGRRPTAIHYSSPEVDAQRRDFTVNGLFYDTQKKEVLDYVGGLRDLRRKVIRAIGDPTQRFKEDHLRLLRAIRFEAQLGFSIEEQTMRAVQSHRELIVGVSKERITEELKKLSMGAWSALGWNKCNDLDWNQLLFGFQKKLSIPWQVPIPMPMELFLAFAEWLLGEEASLPSVLLSSENKVIRKGIKEMLSEIQGRKDLYQCLKKLDQAWAPLFAHYFLMLPLARLKSDQQFLVTALGVFAEVMGDQGRLPGPFITGSELKELGFSQGQRLGEVLELAYRQQLVEKKSKEELIAIVSKLKK